MVDAYIFSSSGYLFQVLLHLDVQKTLIKFLVQISRGQTPLVGHCGRPWAGTDWANRANARSFALEYQNTPFLVFHIFRLLPTRQNCRGFWWLRL